MRIVTIKNILLAAAVTSLSINTLAQEKPNPDQLRAEARELMAKARDLKAEGKFDASEELALRAKELGQKAEQLQNERRRDQPRPEPQGELRRDADRPERPQNRPPHERSDRENIRPSPQRDYAQPDLAPNPPGRPGFSPGYPPMRRFQQPQNLEPLPAPPRFFYQQRAFGPGWRTHIARLQSPHTPFAICPMCQNQWQLPLPQIGPGQPQIQDRKQHLHQAIEHLHAAGLHEPAEKLQQHAQELLQQKLQPDLKQKSHKESPLPPAQLQELHREVKELRNALQELREHLEESLRDRR